VNGGIGDSCGWVMVGGGREQFVISDFRFWISNFDAGVKWILHKPTENTRNATSKKLLDGEVVSLV